MSDRLTNLSVKVDGSWVCKVCGRTYGSRSNLRYHLETQHMQLRLPCNMCPLTFQASENRAKHAKICDGSGSRKYAAAAGKDKKHGKKKKKEDEDDDGDYDYGV